MELVTTRQVALALRTTPALVWYKVKRGKLPAPRKVHMKFWVWEADQLLPWLRWNGQEAAADMLKEMLDESKTEEN